MTKFRLIALLLPAAAGLAFGAVRVAGSAKPSAAFCGGNLWRLKTLSDPARNAVRLSPRSTTIAAIAGRRPPSPTPNRRVTPFQKQNWEVVAQIVNYRKEGGEVRLTLFDDGAYLNAGLPSPSCLTSGSRSRDAISATWRMFTSACAKPTTEWQPLGAVVYIRGVGFWSQRRAEHGTAPNGAELHPVTGLRIVAGCG